MGSARKTIAVVPLSDTMADTARRDATLLAPAALGDRASDDEPFFDIDPNRQPDLWERAGEAYLHRLMGPFVGHLRAAPSGGDECGADQGFGSRCRAAAGAV